MLTLAVVAVAAAYAYQRGAVLAKAAVDHAGLSPSTATAAPAVQAPDLVHGLPLRADLPSAVAHLQAAADRHGVDIVSFSATDRPADAQRLGWTEWVVALRGRYEPVRQVLREMAQAEPVLVLHGLTMRARGDDGELEVEQRWRLPVRSAEVGR